MYKKAYGLIKTLAPLHVGATAGEEAGNLNLIFRDPFLQTGIIPGSSLRGRLRAETRLDKGTEEENYWYGDDGENEEKKTGESRVKFEFASIVWLPVFCPGQPIVWVSCPRLLKRYQRIAGHHVKCTQKNEDGTDKEILLKDLPVNWDKGGDMLYRRSPSLKPLKVDDKEKLFFNFGFLEIEGVMENPEPWFPLGNLPAVIVADDEIGMIHDMALFRQSRVRLEDDVKRVDKGGFFNTEALPEDTQMVFAVALREDAAQPKKTWQPFDESKTGEVFLGGLESIGFGLCEVTIQEV
ncbi:MAG: type III-B CRISPR module RAMP protein Cmr4 [Limnothrix sp.]